MIRFSFLIGFFCILGFSSLCHGERSATKATIIEARTLCYARSPVERVLFIQGAKKDKPVKIALPKRSISRRFKCAVRDGKAIFYKEGKLGENGKPVVVPLAVAKVPAGQKKVLFYFIPKGAGSKLPYEVRVFADDYNKFPLGHTRVINLGSRPSRFVIGEHRSVVREGGVKVFPVVKKKNDFNMGMFRYDVMNKDKKWVTLRERTAKYTMAKRLLVVACYSKRLKRMDVRVYKDFPESS